MVKEKSKIQYFFAHLAFPLANQLYKMKVVAKRIHIPLKSLVDKFVAGLVQSATDGNQNWLARKSKMAEEIYHNQQHSQKMERRSFSSPSTD